MLRLSTTPRRFLRRQEGAVTIDWVALTAGLLLLGIALTYGIFSSGATPAASGINTTLLAIESEVDLGEAPTLNDGE